MWRNNMKKSELRQIIREEINKALPLVRKPLAIEASEVQPNQRPGTIWTAGNSKRFGAKNMDKKVQYFDTQSQAHAWATAKSGKPEKTPICLSCWGDDLNLPGSSKTYRHLERGETCKRCKGYSK